MPTQHILVVDDEQDFARGLARLLASHFPDMAISTAHNGAEALHHLENNSVQLLFSDIRMPVMDGLSLLERALEKHPGLSIVMLTAFGTIETAVEAVKSGAYDFLTKPVEPEQLFRTAEKALERADLKAENERLRSLLTSTGPQLVGSSPAMNALRESISAVARTEYTVLVTGQSGTGKELVSRMIHDSSDRAGKPFISVNCPAIPENLIESELFGHAKGAFTGADRERPGLFAEAEGGTLHLDEIGDLPLLMQTKLLRALQEREVRAVGASSSRTVDVRVIASTNQDLKERIAERTFREDLYYRLNVLTLHLPELSRRREDIPLLATHFLRQSCREQGLEEKDIAAEVLEQLAVRQWPGNVRQLQNFMRRIAVYCSGSTVTLTALYAADTNTTLPEAQSSSGQQSSLQAYKDAKAALIDEFTTGYMHELLERTSGNVSEAARVSGLSRVALQKTLARLGIDAGTYRQ